jgi:manganese-dependent inorganic pyrophosphatase
MFLEQGLTPESRIAGLLCAGILSDTVLFKSPTCTEWDRKMAQLMAQEAGVIPEILGRDMFRASVNMEGRCAQDLFYEDFKEFVLGDERVGVSQIEIMDLEVIESLRDSLKDVMEKARQYAGYDLVVLMITDLLREGTQLMVEGKNPTRIAQAFQDYGGVKVENSAWGDREQSSGQPWERDSVFLPGVISRKKQVVPVLVKYLGQHRG